MNERHPAPINIEGLRQRIRVMAFDRGTPRQVSLWRADISDSRANLVIEGMTPTSDDDDLFALMCGSAWKKDPDSGVIGVEKGPLIPVV